MSFHDQPFSEKRDFIRMHVETSAKLVLPGLGESLAVECQDLSSQGAQITAHQEIAPGTIVELTIDSPTPGLLGLAARGKVTRCAQGETGRYRIGVQFDSVE